MTRTGTASPKRKRLTREQRRELLLDAAAEIAVDAGLGAITMEGVAERAGVSKALPYAYFDNASEVVVALHERENALLDARVGERIADTSSFEEVVRGTLEAWLDVIEERGMLVGALLLEQASGTFEVHRRERLVAVRGFFARLAKDEFGLTNQSANVASAILLAGSLGVVDMLVNRQARREVLVDSFVRIAVQACKALAR